MPPVVDAGLWQNLPSTSKLCSQGNLSLGGPSHRPQATAVYHRANHDNHFEAIARCFALLSVVICFGVVGFCVTEEHWSLWRCLYFTLITITTVGYGDLGISPLGEVVASVLLVCGIGTFTYSLSTLVQIALDEAGARRRKMQRSIEQCNDHIIVCGYGRMGQTICEQLSYGGLDCVVVEFNEHNYEQAIKNGCMALRGRASDDDLLIKAGVERARGVVCAVDSDAENMFISVTVRQLNHNCLVVARAETTDSARKLKHAGANVTVSPHEMAGHSAADSLLRPHLTRIMSGADLEGQFELGEVVVQHKSSLVGKTIQEFGSQAEGVVFVAIRRATGKIVVRPRGRDRFEPEDVVIFAGSHDDACTIHEWASVGDLAFA